MCSARRRMQEGRAVEIGDRMAEDRMKEMMRTYEAYGNRYGREDIARMLEEEESESVEEVPKPVGSEAVLGEKNVGNRNGLEEEMVGNVEADSGGIVEPKRSVGAFMAEVKKRLDMAGTSGGEPERIEDEEDEIGPVPAVVLAEQKASMKKRRGRPKGSKNKATARRLFFSQELA